MIEWVVSEIRTTRPVLPTRQAVDMLEMAMIDAVAYSGERHLRMVKRRTLSRSKLASML